MKKSPQRAVLVFIVLLQIASLGLPTAASDLVAYSHGEWGSMDIYTISVTGGTPTRLTQGFGNNMDPAWSPDGTRIVFWSDRSGEPGIYVMSADGSDQTRISPAGVPAKHPSWSPDGRWIAFSHATEFRIGIMNPEGEEIRYLTTPTWEAWCPDWSQVGSVIVFEGHKQGDAEVCLIDLKSQLVTQLTDNAISDVSPVMSPDGETVVFSSMTLGRQYDIYVADVDGAEVRRLTPSSQHEQHPCWSPDGSRIVYTNSNASLYIMNADGTGRRRLASPGFWTAGPAWQPAEVAPTDDEQAE